MGSIVHLGRGFEMLLAKAVILGCFGISPLKMWQAGITVENHESTDLETRCSMLSTVTVHTNPKF